MTYHAPALNDPFGFPVTSQVMHGLQTYTQHTATRAAGTQRRATTATAAAHF